MPSRNIIGIDLGGTKCAVSLLLSDGSIKEVARFATADCRSTLQRLFDAVEALKLSPEPVFGISCGGPLDEARGLILSPPNLPGWDHTAICTELTSRFGGEAFLMNDANACALAEWRFGAGRGVQDMIFLTAGTGMGAGLILNGRLYEGANGNAGEAGHIRLDATGPTGFGKAGSFEGFCSGGGIARLAHIILAAGRHPVPTWAHDNGGFSARTIAEAAADGDAVALDILQESGKRFGQALAIMIDLLNPERIVIGGIFPRCGHFLLPAMHAALEKEALPPSLSACQIVAAQLGETIGSHGAIAAALYKLQLKPAPQIVSDLREHAF